eukprot:m51a1_g4007 hypothetical protein (397) ;mRNA; r:549294-550716
MALTAAQRTLIITLSVVAACVVLVVCIAVPLSVRHRNDDGPVLPDPWSPVQRSNPPEGPPRADAWPDGFLAAFSVSFDDGYDAMMTTAPQIMRAHGVRGTFFLASNIMDEKPYRWDRARVVHADGNEIGTHGTKHVRESHLPPHILRDDLQTVRTRLSKFLNKSDEIGAWTHAYPYGDNSATTQKVASDIVLAARTCPQSDCQIERPDPANHMRLRACLCSWCSAKWALGNARRAINQNGWMIFVGHGLVSCGEGFVASQGKCVKGYRPQKLEEFGAMLEHVAQWQRNGTMWAAPIIEVFAYGAARRATAVSSVYSNNGMSVNVTVATRTAGLPGGAMAPKRLTYSVPVALGKHLNSTVPQDLATKLVGKDDGLRRVLFSLPVSDKPQTVTLTFSN